MDLFQHPSPFLKPISTLEVFALGALLSGLYRERRYINLEIQYDTIVERSSTCIKSLTVNLAMGFLCRANFGHA